MEQEKELYISYRNVVKTIIEYRKNNEWKLEFNNIISNCSLYEDMKEEIRDVVQQYGYTYIDKNGDYLNIDLLKINILRKMEEDSYCYTMAKDFLKVLKNINENLSYEDVKNNIKDYVFKANSKYYNTKNSALGRFDERYILRAFEVVSEVILYKNISHMEWHGKELLSPDVKELTVKDVLILMP